MVPHAKEMVLHMKEMFPHIMEMFPHIMEMVLHEGNGPAHKGNGPAHKGNGPAHCYTPCNTVPVWIYLEGNTSSMRATILLQMVCNALVRGQRLFLTML